MPKRSKAKQPPQRKRPGPNAETVAAPAPAPAPAPATAIASERSTTTKAAATTAGATTEFKVFELFPVHRDIEVEIVLRTALFNWCLKQNHPIALYSGQMFGSGKTCFAHELLNILRADLDITGPITQALLNPQQLSQDDPRNRCELGAMRVEQGRWNRELIERFANAQFVEVELGLHETREGVLLKLFRAVTGLLLVPPEFAEASVMIDPLVWEECLKRQGKKVPDLWFIFIDEVGRLTGTNLADFFSGFESLLKNPKCFLFFAGRTDCLIRPSLQSTVPIVKLILDPLDVPFILEILEKTYFDGQLVAAVIGANTPEKRLLLAKVLFEYTGGIPRLILYSLRHLCFSHRNIDLNEIVLRKLMEDSVKKYIFAYTDIRNTGFSKELQPLYSAVLFMHSSGLGFSESEMVWYDGDRIRASDLIATLKLYYVKPEGSTLKFTFSKYTLDQFKTVNTTASPLVRVLQATQSLPDSALSAPKTLLFLFAERLWHYLLLPSARVVGAIPGFAGSNIAGVSVEKKELKEAMKTSHFGICHIPSFNATTKPGTCTTIKINGKDVPRSYHPSDWNALIDYLGERWPNLIGIPIGGDSAGPNVLVLFGSSGLSKRLAGLLMFAIKCHHNETKMDWTEINEEVEKGLLAAESANVPGCKLLVIVSTQYTEEINCAFSGDLWISFGEGEWSLDKSSGRVVKAVKRHDKVLFSIPKHCELRIFSPRMINDFIGADAVALLRTVLDKKGLSEEPFNLLLEFHKQIFKRIRTDHCQRPPSPPLSAAAAFAPSPATSVPLLHELFQDPDQEITKDWLAEVNAQILHMRIRPGETLDEKLDHILAKFIANNVSTVGDLSDLDQASIELCGIPGLIACKLYLACHPDEKL